MAEHLTRLFNSIWYEGGALRWPLWPVSGAFRLAAAARRGLYRSGLKRVVPPPVPLVVVGNISVGGTGKTPCVIWLAQSLQARGLAVGIVTRGYGGRSAHWPRRVGEDDDPAEVGDEAVLLAQRTGCAVAAGPDRVAAAALLAEQCRLDVLLSDDGLQHYRMGRSVEIVVIDAARGLGNGSCLPAGPLREPPARLARADAVVVNGAGYRRPGALRAGLVARRAIRLASGAAEPLESFAGRRVHAVAGIGHPERFFALLERAGLRVDRTPLADHAVIEARQLVFDDGCPVMITEKDAVKCRGIAHEDVWCVPVDLYFEGGDGERLLRLVMDRVARRETEQ